MRQGSSAAEIRTAIDFCHDFRSARPSKSGDVPPKRSHDASVNPQSFGRGAKRASWRYIGAASMTAYCVGHRLNAPSLLDPRRRIA
jgi:hypothetical protein